MSRYRGPKLKITRRLGQQLPGFTKKTSTKQLALNQSKGKKSKLSQYAIRLQEKQKLRFNYGVTESQLIKYVKSAKKIKGATGEILLQLLEMRLDNTIFRFGLTSTIASARQLISHGHILVNNQKITIPGYQCEVKDLISVSKNKNSRNLVENFMRNSNSQLIPSHLSFQKESLDGKINNIINRQSINLQINELLIVEYYSRRV
uniref:Small ribosomal subunit protein uS4c n=1 Tax=Prasiolopsis wulf-kochii TaxID=3239232 RepID=A0A097KK03_9CHLO|nr:ribosomal protein S4 [Prasiolopsis sp. SAG 84.81]